VLGVGSYLPAAQVPNDLIAGRAGVTAGWIESKTGILSRRRADPEEAASDLALVAATEALKDAGVDAASVTLIVVATSTPDSPQPATACLLQDRLGAGNAAAFDLNAVCSGFVYALEAARRMLPPGGFALVVGVDVYSRILDPADRRTAVLFGDGAGAVVIGEVGAGRGIGPIRLRSVGSHHDLIRVPGGGSRIPASAESVRLGEHFFTMNGRGVREFVQREVPAATMAFLADHNVDPAAVRHFIPHQANRRLIESLADELALPAARTHLTVDRYGNTGAASLPVTMADARAEFAAGDLVLLAAFGGGMTIGLALLTW
jgi:3-oxoacyl-(acyl-carrier-protein) synthase III